MRWPVLLILSPLEAALILPAEQVGINLLKIKYLFVLK
jgi:hypothetical protein